VEVSGQLHPPLPIGKDTGRAPEPVLTMWRSEFFLSYRDSNSNPSVVQPAGSRYTDCTTGTHEQALYCTVIAQGGVTVATAIAFCRCWVRISVCRHYATSRKVASSRLDEMNEFFSIYLILPAALGPGVYSASNRNLSTRNRKIMFLGSRARSVRRADNLTTICEPTVQTTPHNSAGNWQNRISTNYTVHTMYYVWGHANKTR
jgi:hypothetical protein